MSIVIYIYFAIYKISNKKMTYSIDFYSFCDILLWHILIKALLSARVLLICVIVVFLARLQSRSWSTKAFKFSSEGCFSSRGGRI